MCWAGGSPSPWGPAHPFSLAPTLNSPNTDACLLCLAQVCVGVGGDEEEGSAYLVAPTEVP